MTSEFIKSLGWKSDGWWNNREFFTLGDHTIREHNGDVCYDIDFKPYGEFDKTSLTEFTKLVKLEIDIKNNPSNYTAKDFFDVEEKIKTFIHE